MGISRMAEAQIPTDKGMLVTGHRDVKSYNQYNTNPVKLQMDTCQRIISGDGTKYSEVLSQERKKHVRGAIDVKVKRDFDVKPELQVKAEVKLDIPEGFKPGSKHSPQSQVDYSKPIGQAPRFSKEGNPSSGFVFGSASGCNFFNFTSSVDSKVITHLISKFSKGEIVSSPLSSQ
ncbi:hypothetical protein KC19_VG314400 [Ceratodon purpureus]|uniref:Uncharacterized protein n=1 Tax=Ceratodon purpureus TaxID=3225 RepID=A0A8T0HWG6_CERPU|nr:hypothetical protein KC19_VG314400 [Ceratodon purpureus]